MTHRNYQAFEIMILCESFWQVISRHEFSLDFLFSGMQGIAMDPFKNWERHQVI